MSAVLNSDLNICDQVVTRVYYIAYSLEYIFLVRAQHNVSHILSLHFQIAINESVAWAVKIKNYPKGV